VKALIRLHAEFTRHKAEAKYMAAVFWKALLYKIQISISLKRNGKSYMIRELRLARNALTSTWPNVEVKLETAAQTALAFMRLNKSIKEMRFTLCQAVANMLAL